MTGYKTIFKAGNCERLQEQSEVVSGVIITAKPRNSSPIYFSVGYGANAMEQTEAGIELYGGQRIEFRGGVDLKEIWIAAGTAGDGAYWAAWK